LGDIGRHFPDTSEDFKDADSWVLLQLTGQQIEAKGYSIINIDSTVIAQAPKLAPYINEMRERIATALGITVSQINVKAKTAEKLGPVGELKSMEARAVVLLSFID
jgi:2-C-methyl-D-erythritol 2,4-cyclodiphosphate synthase